ncbi:hypothetical protein C8J56DRAFT_1164560 [Mycena floridula]|nr:hypothetical protein C8J56DRAFT_1164560 [Mycena floridula]
MLRYFAVLFLGFINLLVTALNLSISDSVAYGALAQFQWHATAADPLSFIIEVGPAGKIIGTVGTITRTSSQLEGTGTTLALVTPGPHRLLAVSVESQDILAETDFQLEERLSSKFLSSSKTPSGHITTGSFFRTTEPNQGLPVSSSILSSPAAIDPATGNTSSFPSYRPNNIAAIVGGVCGALVVVTLTVGGLLICRRRRLLRPNAYRLQGGGGGSQGVLSARKNANLRLNGPSHAEKQGLAELVTADGQATERQRSLQARADKINRQLWESQDALNATPEPSPEFVRALVTENIRQNVEIQRLRDLISSDWALGLTDSPPPSYLSSETQ